MLSANEVARYILALQDASAGELISNLKLQKLCYYAQGYFLAFYGEPLFDDEIEAWEHGPVVSDLYHSYKAFGAAGIPIPEDVDFEAYTEREQALIDEVLEVYGQFSAWKLRTMTHQEPPWLEAKDSLTRVISRERMRSYFKTQIEE